ncbi:MAG: C40 family peptidase [Ferruginibacter sp.]
MKNLLFVSVALSVFTVTSQKALAQRKINDVNEFTPLGEGIVYIPAEAKPSRCKASVVSFTKKIMKPVAIATEFCSSLQFKYAQILNRNVELVTNVSLIGFIDEWWGTKYRYGGTTKKGIDCSSFTGLLMGSVFGFALPRTAREQYAVCSKLDKDDMLEGDLVFFNTRGGVSHVGVYLGESYFVHSSCSNGVTISSLNETYYCKRFIGGGRVEEAAYASTHL